MRNDFESNYLAHHGILGMKWGRKNGPPYPLGASDHSATEKKAGWRKSLNGKGKIETKRSKNKPVSTKSESPETTSTKRKGLTEKQKKAIKIGAAVAGTVLVAYGGYKLSKYIKTEAGRRIVAEGNKKAAELIKKAGEYRNLAGSAGNLPGQMHRHMLFTQKAVNTENQAAKLLKDTVNMANNTSSSLKKSYDYLKNDAAKTARANLSFDNLGTTKPSTVKSFDDVFKATQNMPTLKFGESTQKFTKADQDRLSEISNNLLREAQRRNGIATDNTTSFDYAKELIKKNRKTLSQYTMQDLKDLDLY